MRRLLIVCALLLVLLCVDLAVDFPIPDTGQTKFYDDTEEITCPSPFMNRLLRMSLFPPSKKRLLIN